MKRDDKIAKEIFETLIKYSNLTPDAIDDLYFLQGYIEEKDKEIERLQNILDNIGYELEGIIRTTERIGITKNTGYVLSQHNIDLIKKIILKIDEEKK